MRADQTESYQKRRLSEEGIAEVQTEFEKRLEEDIDLPDAITGRMAFVYWHLMRKWFRILVAQERYDEAKSKKIKLDWLQYMELLSEASTAHFLSLEGSEDKRDGYSQRAYSARLRIAAIEEAFAAAVGREAMNELAVVNERYSADVFAFDRTGKKPTAPDGYHYFPDEELTEKTRR